MSIRGLWERYYLDMGQRVCWGLQNGNCRLLYYESSPRGRRGRNKEGIEVVEAQVQFTRKQRRYHPQSGSRLCVYTYLAFFNVDLPNREASLPQKVGVALDPAFDNEKPATVSTLQYRGQNSAPHQGGSKADIIISRNIIAGDEKNVQLSRIPGHWSPSSHCG